MKALVMKEFKPVPQLDWCGQPNRPWRVLRWKTRAHFTPSSKRAKSAAKKHQQPTSTPCEVDRRSVKISHYAVIKKRHLTKGQRAMAVAMIYPERGRGKTPKISEFHPDYLRQARTVLEVLPELAAQVRDGDIPLSEAYEKAQFERKASV